MGTLYDEAIASTDPIDVDHGSASGNATTVIVAATTADITVSYQLFCGPTIGYVEFDTATVSAGGIDIVVYDLQSNQLRVRCTPSTGSGHLFVKITDQKR